MSKCSLSVHVHPFMEDQYNALIFKTNQMKCLISRKHHFCKHRQILRSLRLPPPLTNPSIITREDRERDEHNSHSKPLALALPTPLQKQLHRNCDNTPHHLPQSTKVRTPWAMYILVKEILNY